MTAARTPLFERLIVTGPNIGGGLGVIDSGCCFFLDGFRSTGICSVGDRLIVGRQPGHVVTIEAGRAEALAPEFPDIHDLASIDGTTYAVVTTRNEVVAIDADGTTLRSWRLPGGDDACHVNCLAEWNGRVVFSLFGDFTEPRGYKGNSLETGQIRDLETGERIIAGLHHPHSPTPFRGGLLVADSGNAALAVYDAGLTRVRSVPLGGYTRGIHVGATAIYVGISHSRSEGDAGPGRARLVALDPDTFEEVGRIDLPSKEIYEVTALPDTMQPVALVTALASLEQRISA